MIRVKVDLRDEASPALRRLARVLHPEVINRAIAPEAERMTKRYLVDESSKRHRTANRLGADPTGVIARTAGKVTSKATARAAEVEIPHPLFARAFRRVTIRPKSGSALTIPVHPLAYGRRARSIPGLVKIKSGEDAILARPKKGSDFLEVFYLLKKQVVQEQDRTLLPDDAMIRDSALRGARRLLEVALARKGGSNG